MRLLLNKIISFNSNIISSGTFGNIQKKKTPEVSFYILKTNKNIRQSKKNLFHQLSLKEIQK